MIETIQGIAAGLFIIVLLLSAAFGTLSLVFGLIALLVRGLDSLTSQNTPGRNKNTTAKRRRITWFEEQPDDFVYSEEDIKKHGH